MQDRHKREIVKRNQQNIIFVASCTEQQVKFIKRNEKILRFSCRKVLGINLAAKSYISLFLEMEK